MVREYFLTTDRLGFSHWQQSDGDLAKLLWGDPEVSRYITASGVFSEEEISARLRLEIENQKNFGVQYWPLFSLQSGELVGCCGLRPKGDGCYELGFHLRPMFWSKGLGHEAASAVIDYAFSVLGAQLLTAGHNPNNERSRRLLLKLGFAYTEHRLYPPTGLMHPSYLLRRD